MLKSQFWVHFEVDRGWSWVVTDYTVGFLLFLVYAKLIQTIICAWIGPRFLLRVSFSIRLPPFMIVQHGISTIRSQYWRPLLFYVPVIGLIGSIWAWPIVLRVDWIYHDRTGHVLVILCIGLIFPTFLSQKIHKRCCIFFSIVLVFQVSFSGRLVLIGYKEIIWWLIWWGIIDFVSVLDTFVIKTLVEVEGLAG